MAMDYDELARLRERVISRERPYDLGIVPDNRQFEYTDPRNEEATLARWQPVLERLNILILGVRDVPSEPVRVTVDGIEWLLSRMGNKRYDIPESAYHTIRAAQAAGVPFGYWLWGEEQFDRPEFYPQKPKNASWKSSLERSWNEWQEKLSDPIVIGVIPTAPNRGIFCLLGKWFH